MPFDFGGGLSSYKIIENSGLALHKTRNLLSITDKILASKRLAVFDDAWLDELIAWADENDIPDYYFDDESESWYGFPRDKQQILAMTELALSSNELTELPESIGKLTNLTMLCVSCNGLLFSLPESIGNLTNLTGLSFSSNALCSLPESIGNLINLTWLVVNGNSLFSLPESIGNLTNLTSLCVSGNKLSSLPESSNSHYEIKRS